MGRCTGRCDITEMLLKTALNTIQLIIQSSSRNYNGKWTDQGHELISPQNTLKGGEKNRPHRLQTFTQKVKG